MTAVHANRLIIAVQFVIVCAITLSVLTLAEYVAGRAGLWIGGLFLLFLTGAAFYRLRKKV